MSQQLHKQCSSSRGTAAPLPGCNPECRPLKDSIPSLRDPLDPDEECREPPPPPGPQFKPGPPPPPSGGSSGGSASSQILRPKDPNEKFGIAGYGPEAFITAGTTIPYRINFENLGPGSEPVPSEPATAPAKRVVVTDQLSADLDWSTLAFTEAGFGDQFFEIPAGRQYHFDTLEMEWAGETFDVELELSFNPASGELRAVFQSVNPETFLPPSALLGIPPARGRHRRRQGFCRLHDRRP